MQFQFKWSSFMTFIYEWLKIDVADLNLKWHNQFKCVHIQYCATAISKFDYHSVCFIISVTFDWDYKIYAYCKATS